MTQRSIGLIAAFGLVALISSIFTWNLVRSGADSRGQRAGLVSAADLFRAENRLRVEQGSVDIVHADGTSDTVVSEASVVVGDEITVSSNGFAAIYWFDDSVSRLKSGTTMRITAADYAPEDISQTHIDFDVVAGTVWSKVMDLVNGSSRFTASGGGVVAGVRGTIFNITVADSGVTLDALEHTTFVQLDEETQDVSEGSTAWLPRKGMPEWKTGMSASRVATLTDTKLRSDWFMLNAKEDRRVAADIRATHLAKARAIADGAALPDFAQQLREQIASGDVSADDLVHARAMLMMVNRAMQSGDVSVIESSSSAEAIVPVVSPRPVLIAPVVTEAPVEPVVTPEPVITEDPKIRARVDVLLATFKQYATEDPAELPVYLKYASLAAGPVDLALMNEIAGQVERIEKKRAAAAEVIVR